MHHQVIAVAASLTTIHASLAQAEIVQFFAQDLTGAMQGVPFSVLDEPGTSFFSMQIDYDTDRNRVVAVTSTVGWPTTSYFEEFDFINTVYLDNGLTRIHCLSQSREEQTNLVLRGNLADRGQLEIVPFDPDATNVAGTSGRDALELLTAGSWAWGTMYLVFPDVPVLTERGGPTAADLGSFPGRTFVFQPRRCSVADTVAPFGLLDLADVDAFVVAFVAGDLVADVAAPFGILDLADIDSFIAGFLAGCP